ncbi:alpha/beta hydrolase family protein [Cryptosporangium minutisporangium]|uniref:alpha/beta hydrolase family protein n=1 Tax=Cryptosporangium minutisporangium TaxID=113569 RepID=UPI0035EC6D8E
MSFLRSPGRSRRGRIPLPGFLLIIAALVAGGLTAAPTAQAADNPYQRGPDPTNASIEATTGPFAVDSQPIVGATGFGGGQIYYPRDTSQTYGAVVIVPGFLSVWAQLNWLGPRLASQGFVVVGIETSGTTDLPDARGNQALAALDWATNRSSVASRIDRTRLAAAGWSMGGGGLRRAALQRPSLKAIVGMAPWNGERNWSSVTVPTMFFGGSSDVVASPNDHAKPFYNSITRAEKDYIELRNADHFFPTSANTTMAKYFISWLKRWVDNDTRYTQFLCPGPSTGLFAPVSASMNTCPF